MPAKFQGDSSIHHFVSENIAEWEEKSKRGMQKEKMIQSKKNTPGQKHRKPIIFPYFPDNLG